MIKSPNKNYNTTIQKKFKENLGQASNETQKIKNFLQSNSKKVTRTLLILVCSFLFVIIFINREKLSPEYVGAFFDDVFAQIQHGGGYPYKISGNRVSCENFKSIDKNLFILSDTSFVSLNGSAKEMNRKQHCYQNPMLRVSDNRAIMYDLGGKHIEISSKSQVLHTAVLEDNIISAAISNQGTYGVVTESKGFLGQLTVFSKNGNDIYYKYKFADHYITDMTISDNGKSAAVCGSTSQNGSLVSTVYVFDYKDEVPKAKFDYADNMIIRLEYMSNGNIVAVGDRFVSIINPTKGTKKDYDYENRTLIGFDINKQDGILLTLSLSEDGNNAEMILINKSGKTGNIIDTGHNIKSVSFKNGRLAALSYGKLYIYNSSGNLLKTMDVGSDARNVNLISSKKAYILGVTEIRKVSF